MPKPAVVENTDQVGFLTMDEIKELIQEMRDRNYDKLILIIQLVSLTGLLYGELAALTPAKINLESHTITVNETYDFNHHTLTASKTKGAKRIVSISSNIITNLKDLIDSPHTSDFLFSSPQGKPISNVHVNRKLKRYMPEKEFRMHIFRHSHISYLAEKDIPLRVIMDRVGHSYPKTTLAICSHTTQNMQDTINDRVNNLYF